MTHFDDKKKIKSIFYSKDTAKRLYNLIDIIWHSVEMLRRD